MRVRSSALGSPLAASTTHAPMPSASDATTRLGHFIDSTPGGVRDLSAGGVRDDFVAASEEPSPSPPDERELTGRPAGASKAKENPCASAFGSVPSVR